MYFTRRPWGKLQNSILCLSSLHPEVVEFVSEIDCLALSQHLAPLVVLAAENGFQMGLKCCLIVLSLSAGVGGNLVAVQASRISTYLHMSGMPGESPETAPRKCPSPCSTFFSSGTQVMD